MHAPRPLRAVALTALLTLAACAAKNPDAVTAPARDLVTQPAPAPKPAPVAVAATDDANDGAAPSFEPIHYALDSAQLLPESMDELGRLADHLRTRRTATIVISGHTCELGTSEYNLALGQKRAAAAKDYLEKLGVDPRRINVLSYGEERPLDDEHTEPARAKNRRSEFAISVAVGSARE